MCNIVEPVDYTTTVVQEFPEYTAVSSKTVNDANQKTGPIMLWRPRDECLPAPPTPTPAPTPTPTSVGRTYQMDNRGCMYSSMDHVPWDADEGTWANTCQGGSTGVLMTLPTGWFIAQDDAQARDVIKRSWFATTCMLVGRDSGRGYFTRAHTDAHAAGSDCGHSQILSNEGDASCGSYVPSQGCQYAVKNFPMRILIAKAQQVSCCGMYRRG